MGHPAENPAQTYTYQDYLSWNDDLRWELINGEAFHMTPAPNRKHQEILGKLYLRIAAFLDNKPCKIYLAPFDVRLPDADLANDKIINVVQPDIVVYCDPKKLDEKGGLGAPDFVIEILSESTATRDLNKKMRLYEKYGVAEYWIVDPWNETVTVYIHNGQKLMSEAIYKQGDALRLKTFPDLVVNMIDIFSR